MVSFLLMKEFYLFQFTPDRRNYGVKPSLKCLRKLIMNDRKRILFVIGQLSVGGAERQMIYLATHLDKSKYQVLVCSFSADVPLLSILNNANVQTVIIPQAMKPDLTRPIKLFQLTKSYKPDLIHSYLFVANTWARIIGSILKVPVVLSERSSEIKKTTWVKIINRTLVSYGSHLIANSQSGADRVIQNNEFSPDKVSIIYNGIPIDKYNCRISEEQKAKLLYEFGIKEGTQVIGLIGRLSFAKNHELLFESYKTIVEHFPHSRILCVGDGPRKKELMQLVETFGIKDHVFFTGMRKDIPECFSIMDVMVLPSRWEGLPNVILEAMAAKCPVVAADVGGVSELVTDGVTGWLVEPGNKDELANKVIVALSDFQQLEKVKRNAYAFVTENFSIEKMVTYTEKVYEEVIGDR